MPSSGRSDVSWSSPLRIELADAPADVDAAPLLRDPLAVWSLMRERIARSDRERFCALLLNSRHRLIAVDEVSVGSLNQSLVHPREVFKGAILANAAALVVAHNHPSGDPRPSAEDHEVTGRLVEAGSLLGIRVLDHVIVVVDRFYSFAENDPSFGRGEGYIRPQGGGGAPTMREGVDGGRRGNAGRGAPGRAVRFPLGQTVATPGALDALERAGVGAIALLARHAAGDWGDLGEDDRRANDGALSTGARLFSSYDIDEGLTVWVITEADRSSTTILLPSEY